MNTTMLAAGTVAMLLSRLTQAWTWLAEAVTPGPVAYIERGLSDAGRRNLDRLVAAERAERVLLTRNGLIPRPPTPAPARITPIDTQLAIATAVTDLAWIVASDLRDHPHRPSYQPAPHTVDNRFTTAMAYLRAATPLLAATTVLDQLVEQLSQLDETARTIAGAGPDPRILKAQCPACQHRATLRADLAAHNPKDWTITCVHPTCRCQGINCGCHIPTRHPGARHIWTKTVWGHLGQLLTQQDTP